MNIAQRKFNIAEQRFLLAEIVFHLEPNFMGEGEGIMQQNEENSVEHISFMQKIFNN